jgi:anthranilate/para-aminobenzoate synthase component I
VRDLAPTLARDGPAVLLDGPAWGATPILALAPRIVEQSSGGDPALERLDRLVTARRRAGGGATTGVVVLAGYELFAGGSRGTPAWVVVEVDRAVVDGASGPELAGVARGDVPAEVRAALEANARGLTPERTSEDGPARASGRPRTSLPHATYLLAVERLLDHIGRGDIYQANLCQRIDVPYRGDELALHLELGARFPAPHAAFVRGDGFALSSASPETFLTIAPDGGIETFPIKGTRPRSDDPALDRAAADELLRCPKDRAELLMIVDLERNDLSRVCTAGTVEVPEPCALRSFAHVHHLVATVRGRMKPGIGPADVLRATFPGGSITGAPKRRATEILREVENVERGFFTGSLFWLGDDGRTSSSILIRTIVFRGGTASIGAGGGIVADSDPEAEWRESSHKARALCRSLGFEPEEAA